MIKILCVGKLKEKYLTDATLEYLKRIRKYTNIEIIELPDSNIDDMNIALDKEKKHIEKYINPKDFMITMEIEGKQLTSEELADKIDKLGIQGTSHIIFIIGGSIGLGEEVLKKSDFALSFSKMTFPHQLMRVILLEQVYRSYRIINGEPYHK